MSPGKAATSVYVSCRPATNPSATSPACSKSGEVVSLEVRKRSLEAGMIERRSEIEVQLELMQASVGC